MKKTLLLLTILLLLAACATNRKSTSDNPDKGNAKFQPEHRLIVDIIKVIYKKYYRPVSYQALVIGAVQGLEKEVGTTGLIRKLNPGEFSSIEKKGNTFGSGHDEDIYTCVREILNIIEFGTEKFKGYSKKEIVFSMIQGMMSKLDEKSAFLTPEEFEYLSVNPVSSAATGIVLSIRNNYPVVNATICNSPAQKAGIQPGDEIDAIDNVSTNGKKLPFIVKQLRGPKDSELTLTILKDQTFAKEKILLKREIIPEKTVYTGEINNGYAHIWVKNMMPSTVRELSAILDEVENIQPIKGIVLDLRDNPGGLLDQAIRIADMFLQDGIITTLKGRNPKNTRIYMANPDGIKMTCKVAILVNDRTASGAEIIAAALQDHKRAMVLGVPTYGARDVQAITNLRMGCALKYTVAHMQRPNCEQEGDGRIKPNIIIEDSPREYIKNTCELKTDSLVKRAIAVLSQKQSY